MKSFFRIFKIFLILTILYGCVDTEEVAYYNQGLAYFNKGQYDKAISDTSKAIEINPRDADAYNNRGNAY